MVEGDLHGLTLKELDIRDTYASFKGNICLPASATTLTRLSLLFNDEGFWPDASASHISESLDSFVSLNSLSLSPLTRDVAQWIRRANIALADLRIVLSNTPDRLDGKESSGDMEWLMSNFEKLMSSTSICSLKELRLVTIFDGDGLRAKDFGAKTLETIKKQQSSLSKLVLSVDYDDRTLSLLEGLDYVDTLIWYLPHIAGPELPTFETKLSQHSAVTKVFPYDSRNMFAPLVDQ
jgi:hypothetical protein